MSLRSDWNNWNDWNVWNCWNRFQGHFELLNIEPEPPQGLERLELLEQASFE